MFLNKFHVLLCRDSYSLYLLGLLFLYLIGLNRCLLRQTRATHQIWLVSTVNYKMRFPGLVVQNLTLIIPYPRNVNIITFIVGSLK